MPQPPSAEELSRWHRWFAVECNNRAWQLADQAERTAAEDDEMLNAAHVKPGEVATLAAQADLAPTVLGLMNASYDSRFFGRDLFAGKPEGRAFLSTFQKMGLLKDGQLAVLGPKKYLKTYKWDEAAKTIAETPEDKALEEEAVSFYQGANYVYKKRLNRLK